MASTRQAKGEVEGKSARLASALTSFQCECATCLGFEDGAADPSTKPPWRKLLYISQPYADNHTDADTFLEDMVMNADVSTPSYWPTVEASLVVAHEVATVSLVVAVFAFHFSSLLSLESLYALNASFLVGGLMLAALAEAAIAARERRDSSSAEFNSPNSSPVKPSMNPTSRSPAPVSSHSLVSTSNGDAPLQRTPSSSSFPPPFPHSALRQWWSVLSTCCLLSLHLLLLSPVFHTLTRSISSDTIWASTAHLLLLHLFLHDYSYSAALSPTFSSYVALLSALGACVLLASRLPTPAHAFVSLSFGLQCFGLLPGILHKVARASDRSHRVVVVSLLGLSVGLVYHWSSLAGAALAVLLLFVIFICPAILVHMHRSYKSTIQGPWDEAKLQHSKSH